MCMTVRVDADTLEGLEAEAGDSSLSKLLNKKVKRALIILGKEVHKNE